MTTTIDQLFNVADYVTEEEREWQLKAREFAQTRIRPIIDQAFEDRRLPVELLPEVGEFGAFGMYLEGYGLRGASSVAYGLVAMEFEAVDSGFRTALSVQGSLAMGAIYKFGSEEQKQQWLPAMGRGEAIGFFGLTEPQGGSDPNTMLTTARRDGDQWVLNGKKRWIGLATIASVGVIWAKDEEGIVRGFVVPTDTPGFQATAIENKLSMRASLQTEIELTDVRLPLDAILPKSKGLSSPFKCLNEARYGIAWGVMGAARSCLEVAVERSQTREVFGTPIGGKQIIQAQLADMFLEYQKGLLLALHLGRLKDAGNLTYGQISVGKLNNVREAIKIANNARSILGGDGITSDFPVMRHMANLESVRTYEGTDEVHQLVIGRELTGIAAF
ncbi:acyl-CoA dehydrogenase family protein [Leucobacter rhizosphaerae]|uniref:Acyl-CoA dehydrogenase family protein n=1 Tax=Leucobacter rhizosphaerae TaxID=2932245 RepID=A0ABY4FV10_9MICO|nr:acyl-CoA dehydrogenase family protein [Leucobacter rhizosphaerae]UOQ60107.1 acyl-CoA dehydrogenase family protein [Leucobacter rhizosphaerae]